MKVIQEEILSNGVTVFMVEYPSLKIGSSTLKCPHLVSYGDTDKGVSILPTNWEFECKVRIWQQCKGTNMRNLQEAIKPLTLLQAQKRFVELVTVLTTLTIER